MHERVSAVTQRPTRAAEIAAPGPWCPNLDRDGIHALGHLVRHVIVPRYARDPGES